MERWESTPRNKQRRMFQAELLRQSALEAEWQFPRHKEISGDLFRLLISMHYWAQVGPEDPWYCKGWRRYSNEKLPFLVHLMLVLLDTVDRNSQPRLFRVCERLILDQIQYGLEDAIRTPEIIRSFQRVFLSSKVPVCSDRQLSKVANNASF
jgi:hypothetical protein